MLDNRTINIFTSCNDNYTKWLPTLFVSLHEHLCQYHIRLFLLHTAISNDRVAVLRKSAKQFDIDFQDIIISANYIEKYREIKNLTSKESIFPVEGFLCIAPHIHLPEDVDRVLYLDAGDIILAGDISEFYFSAFNGNLLAVSKGFASDWGYSAYDLYDRPSYLQIGSEYFNSGVVLFNIELMRKMNITLDYYADLTKYIRGVHDGYNWDTFGGGKRYVVQDDQGLLGAAYVGWINFYDPNNRGNIDTSYNFRPFVFECNKAKIENADLLSLKSLNPRILHLLGNKPWDTDRQKRAALLPLSRECLDLFDKYTAKAHSAMKRTDRLLLEGRDI